MSEQYKKKIVITGHRGAVGTEIIRFFTSKGIEHYLYRDAKVPTGCDILLHLAVKTSSCPDIISSNIKYLYNIIDFAKNNGIKLFVFFSTIKVYGNHDFEDLDEHTLCILEDLDLYSASKIFGELMLKDADLNVLCLRLPAILTKDLSKTFLGRAVAKLLNNQDIVISNADKVYNNFIDIQSILKFILQYTPHNKFEIFNHAAQKHLSLAQIMTLLKEETASKAKIIFSDSKQKFFNISTSKAQAYGFDPPMPANILKPWLRDIISSK